MKQEQLLDDDRESEIIDKKILLLLVISSIVFPYLNRISESTINNKSPFDDRVYGDLLDSIGFVVGAFIYYFFWQSKWIVFIGFLGVMIFCILEIYTLSLGNYFDNWAQIYLLHFGKGFITFPLTFIFLNRSNASGKKQTYYLFLAYLYPILFTLLELNRGEYILTENTGLFPLGICFMLMALCLFIFTKTKSSLSQEKFLPKETLSPNNTLIVFWSILLVLILICGRSIVCNVPDGMDIDLFFGNFDLANLIGTLCCALFASIFFLRTGSFSYKKLLKTGVVIFCPIIFIYCTLFFSYKETHAPYLIFQILIQLIFMSAYVIFVGFFSYLIIFSKSKHYVFILLSSLIPQILISSLTVALGFFNALNLLRGDIIYVIMLLSAIGSVLFLLYLNRTHNPISDDDRTHRLQP